MKRLADSGARRTNIPEGRVLQGRRSRPWLPRSPHLRAPSPSVAPPAAAVFDGVVAHSIRSSAPTLGYVLWLFSTRSQSPPEAWAGGWLN